MGYSSRGQMVNRTGYLIQLIVPSFIREIGFGNNINKLVVDDERHMLYCLYKHNMIYGYYLGEKGMFLSFPIIVQILSLNAVLPFLVFMMIFFSIASVIVKVVVQTFSLLFRISQIVLMLYFFPFSYLVEFPCVSLSSSKVCFRKHFYCCGYQIKSSFVLHSQ